MEKSKPKIGIITFWDTQENYGQLLQCYALQEVLKQLGGDPFLIKYECTQMSKSQIIFRWLSVLFTFQLRRVIKSITARIEKQKLTDRGFYKFRETYIKSTEAVYSLAKLKSNSPVADYYVCGSDQIWNQYDRGYFLEWGDKHIPRIAYAASFGTPNVSKEFANEISKSFKKFQVVTVREQSGIDICKQAGYFDALCVPDPALLLTGKDYEKLIVKNTTVLTHKNYLLVYLLGHDTNINFEDIKCFAKQKGLEIKYVPAIGGSKKGHNDEWAQTFPSMSEWLFLVANAKYVLTNSFHGTVFSILFARSFGVYILKGTASKMNDRIYTLLDNIKLRDRIITDNLQILDNPVNYVEVNTILNMQRENIKNYFKEWFHL